MPKKKKTELDFYELMEQDFSDFVTYTDRDDPNKIAGIVSTGVPSLDVSIGIGGIPLGRFTEIYGPESSGKTTLALNVVKNAILAGYNVLYVDPEQGIDIEFARSIAGDLIDDLQRFVLMQPNTMEETLGIAEAGVQSGHFNLVILDSIGAMAPKKVQEKELEDNTMGLLAKRMTIFLQRNAFPVRYGDVAFLGINQVRDKISFFGGLETPGGHAWKHLCSLRIELRKLSGSAGNISVGDDIVGINTKFLIKKSKVGAPYRSFYFPIMFDIGIDKPRDLVDFATTLGVIIKKGSFYTFEDETIGQGKDATIEKLRNNSELLDKIEKMCYNTVNEGNTLVEDFGMEEEDGEVVEG